LVIVVAVGWHTSDKLHDVVPVNRFEFVIGHLSLSFFNLVLRDGIFDETRFLKKKGPASREQTGYSCWLAWNKLVENLLYRYFPAYVRALRLPLVVALSSVYTNLCSKKENV
jgi:hypothetical protein